MNHHLLGLRCGGIRFALIGVILLLPLGIPPLHGGGLAAVAGDTPRVLVVHSYHRDYEWTASLTRGLRQVLPAREIDLQLFHMDTKRHPDESWAADKRAAALLAVNEWDPDVVIATDDNAQQWFARYLVGRERPQIVFVGVNTEPEAYGYPAENVTGVLERPRAEASVALLQRMFPQVRRIALISDDSSTSQYAVAHLTSRNGDFAFVSVDMPRDFAGWQAAVARARTSADAIAVFTYHTVRRWPQDSISMPPSEVMAWTVEHAGIPVLGFLNFAVDDGAACGVVDLGAEHGRLAGKLALRLLANERAGDIPIISSAAGQSMVNMASARRWGFEPTPVFLNEIDLVVGY
jgi:ABC-type uncharacterized transport system substrate-binding protein